VYQDPRLASQQNSSPARVDTESANPSDFIDLTQSGASPKSVSSSSFNKNNSSDPISNFFGGINTGQPEPNFEVHTVPDTRDPLSQFILPGSNVDLSKQQYEPNFEAPSIQGQQKSWFGQSQPLPHKSVSDLNKPSVFEILKQKVVPSSSKPRVVRSESAEFY
jgi:hypothetical protein